MWDSRRNVQKPVFEIKEMDEFVSCMVTDDHCKLLLCTSGEGTLAAFNPRAKKMVGQVIETLKYQFTLVTCINIIISDSLKFIHLR